MSPGNRSAKLWRAGVAALVVLLGVGVFAATTRTRDTSERDSTGALAQPGQLVNALGAEDLEKFAVVDMADAVGRVSRAEVAAQSR